MIWRMGQSSLADDINWEDLLILLSRGTSIAWRNGLKGIS